MRSIMVCACKRGLIINRRSLPAVVLCMHVACAVAAGDAIAVLDDDSQVVQLSSPAMRIISLAPSLTELLYAAGAGNQIVGVVEYSDFPPAARRIPIVGRYDRLDMESILALQPDLVVAWKTGNPRAAVSRLRELGLAVYVAEPKQLKNILIPGSRTST